MKYCHKCVLPNTRPHLVLDKDGICNACLNHSNRTDVNWEGRKKNFKNLVSSVKDKNSRYDCVIPVSGGKDSTWQVVKCLEYGLHPLAVTWKPPARTEIGRQNLSNLISLGVDHIDFQVNPKVEKRFMLKAFRKYGSTAIPMHMGLFNIPLTMAIKFSVPLVVWGENSAVEYGGSSKNEDNFILNQEWIKKYGVTQGTIASDWISNDLSENDMRPYMAPDENEIKNNQTRGIFLGEYFEWDPELSLSVAKKNGFIARSEGPKTGFYNYADIDDDFISIHHYLKWHKFGFTRLFDNLSIEIRNGRLDRNKAINIIQSTGDPTPHDDIEKFCNFVDISTKEFHEIANGFRNKKIWHQESGVWKMKEFIIKEWNWNG